MSDQNNKILITETKVKSSWSEIPKREILEQNPELKDKVEVLEKRKPHSKTFHLGKDKFRVVNKLGDFVHYKHNPDDTKEEWKDIDLTLIKKGTNYFCDKTFYDVEVFTDRVGYSYRSKRGGTVEVELVEVGGVPVDNSKITYLADRNQLFWYGAAKGLEMKILLFPVRVEIFKKLDDASAPRKLKWKITEDIKSNCNFAKKTRGNDNKAQAMRMLTTIAGEKTIGTKKTYHYEEEWTGEVSRVVDKKTRQKDWKGVVSYPVVIDATTTENIVAGADDVWQQITPGGTGSYFHPTQTKINAGRFYSSFEHLGVRFQTLGIPQGAVINSATLKLNIFVLGGSPKIKIYGDDVDNAAAWATNDLPTNITKTTASKIWSPTAIGLASVSITGIIQEIISRTGWVSSNNIRLGVLSNNAASGINRFKADAYEKAGGTPASLVVDYTAASSDLSISILETVSITENINIVTIFNFFVSDSIVITKNINILTTLNISNNDIVSISEINIMNIVLQDLNINFTNMTGKIIIIS